LMDAARLSAFSVLGGQCAMTVETGPAIGAPNWAARGRHLPIRNLWQVPTFLVGLLALLIACIGHPFWAGNTHRQQERRLAQARKQLDQARPDLDEVIALASRVASEAEPNSRLAGQANFVLGTAHMRRAEQAAPEFAEVSWKQARLHLEAAEKCGVSPKDMLHLTYRLAKTWHTLSANPQQVVDLLKRSMSDADDPFEGYGVLARAYLRLPQPDLAAALQATQKQLALANIEPGQLGPPRLLCGELLRRLDQPEEARKVLSRIGPGSPPDVIFQARYLRARILQDDGNWTEAAQLWELVRVDLHAPQAERSQAAYYLGLCYRKLDQLPQAQRVWEEAIKNGGEEAQAAALGLAELRLRGDSSAAALDAYEAALRNVNSPSDYANPLLDINEARSRFESGCRWYLQIGNYEAAQALAHMYEKLAAAGTAQELVGQAAEAWGKGLVEQAASSSTTPVGKQYAEEALKHFREAAAAFESAANQSTNPAEQANWLWRSADNYLKGQDYTRGLPVLERYVGLSQVVTPEKLGEAWFLRGEAFRATHSDVAAGTAYRRCIEYPGSFGCRARYQLAMAEIEQNNLEEAAAMLVQNLEILNSINSTDLEAHESTLYALANLLFQMGDYKSAYVRLQMALERYPNNPSATKTRYQLAQCALRRSQEIEKLGNEGKLPPDLSAKYRREQGTYLDVATLNYQRVADELSTARASRALSRDEETLFRQAVFAVAECKFKLGQYDDALKQYEELSKRFPLEVEELIALLNAWRCYGMKFQNDKAKATLDRIRLSLQAMPNTAFDNSSEPRTRRWWENWLAENSRAGL
jgi:tetratricopeptide (TPR) repeat protein